MYIENYSFFRQVYSLKLLNAFGLLETFLTL